MQQTIEKTKPEELEHFEKYRLKTYIDDHFEMPDKTVGLLIRFLELGIGKPSQLAKTTEFKSLNEGEFETIQKKYVEIFP